MKRSGTALLVAAVAALSAFAGYWTQHRVQSDGASGVTAEQGAPILALTLPDADNRPQALDQWRGKVLVVNFWATWCPPCLRELPEFSDVARRHADQPVQFVGISIDRLENVRHFVSITQIPYPLLIGSPETVDLTVPLGNTAHALPFTAIFDRAGTLRFVKLGTLNADELAGKIRALLDRP
ncbi:MAG TPA: TlpA disulfide reductase family protein [Aromatoleum sp.]|uniref:TlpA family protein disulfide reductase n=1 Tax=Aromatoleum sp. TaxID=2307007 RepID=UPI002B460A6A|nr:TlpA disulfide reductase family protein [Aromatoleum sp.]HJV25117.1 TlpA disulfide reductase family protein [Aromatoleum sp.]